GPIPIIPDPIAPVLCAASRSQAPIRQVVQERSDIGRREIAPSVNRIQYPPPNPRVAPDCGVHHALGLEMKCYLRQKGSCHSRQLFLQGGAPRRSTRYIPYVLSWHSRYLVSSRPLRWRPVRERSRARRTPL